MSEAPVSPADAAARIAALEALLARANAALAARDLLIDTLRGQIARLWRMQFGASSEKLGREIEQLELALEELETERDASVPEVVGPGIASRPVPVRSLPGHLPREDIIHDPASGACTYPDCGVAPARLGRARDSGHRAGALARRAQRPPQIQLPGMREDHPGARAGLSGILCGRP